MRSATSISRRRRHNKVLKATKGYRMTKNRLYKVAHEAMMHAGQYSYAHRRRRLSQMRTLWIKRLNAAAQLNGLTYSALMHGLKTANIQINRKVLSQIALETPEVFSQIVKSF